MRPSNSSQLRVHGTVALDEPVIESLKSHGEGVDFGASLKCVQLPSQHCNVAVSHAPELPKSAPPPKTVIFFRTAR